MDSQGYVSLVVISRFNRVRALTPDLSLIKISLGDSTFLELIDDKIRRKSGWDQWVPPTGGEPDTVHVMMTEAAVKIPLLFSTVVAVCYINGLHYDFLAVILF